MKFEVGDIVDRRGYQPWYKKTGLLVQIKYDHATPRYGVIWFGSAKVVFYEAMDLKPHQRVEN